MKTNMNWCFARVNNKLAEIFFTHKNGKVDILGHCYVDRNEYKTKKEQQWIEKEEKKFKVTYRNKKYTTKNLI